MQSFSKYFNFEVIKQLGNSILENIFKSKKLTTLSLFSAFALIVSSYM